MDTLATDALWLDDEKISPLSLYQYLAYLSDVNVERMLKLLTFLELSEIEDIMTRHRKTPASREAQIKLANEITLLLHGSEYYASAIIEFAY